MKRNSTRLTPPNSGDVRWTRHIFTGAALWCLAGCAAPLFHGGYTGLDVAAERLRSIDSIDLAAESTSDPVTVEQASEAVIEQIVQPTEALESVALTLEQVRAAALTGNLDLQVQLFTPTISQASVDEEAAKFEATFTGSARHSSFDSPTSLGTEASQSTIDQFNAGVNIPLRTGGMISLSAPFTRSSTNNPFALLNPSYNVDLQATISQPLLRNAGWYVNTHSIRVAEHQAAIADAQTKLQAVLILADADRKYWTLYAALGELEVRQRQYEVAVEQLEQARRKVQAGDLAPIEITRAESAVASTVESIIIAENAARRSERDLKRHINRDDLPVASATRIEISTGATPVGLDLDPQALTRYAIENRMEMLELELQIAVDTMNIEFQRNQKLPLLDVDLTRNVNGLAGSLGNAFDQASALNFQDWILGLRAEVPIGNEAAEARFRRAVLQRLQRIASKEAREQTIEQEVLDALDQLDQAWQRIIAARRESILSSQTYDAERRQFDQGLRTSTDVDDALTRLADAQSREIRAVADYEIAMISLASATGTLLGHDRVVWEPQALPEG